MKRMPRAFPLIVLLGLLLVPAVSGAGPASPPVLRHRYADGLTLLVRESPAAPVVAVSLQVRMGARWERAETAGISNLLQQTMVKGTARRTAAEIAETAEEIGGALSAASDTDSSEIRGTALARHWKALLNLVADVALRPSLPSEEIEKERGAILSRIRSRGDLPFSLAFDGLLASLYGPHPYGLPALGRQEALDRLDRASLLEHYRRFYLAGRMVLAVSGQIPTAAVVDEVGRLFTGLPAGSGAAPDAPPAPAPTYGRGVLERPAAQAQILVGYLTPPLSHPDYPAVKVLSALLGGGMSSRLFAELRNRQGLAYSLGSLYPSRVDTSSLVIHMGTAPDNLGRAEVGIGHETARIRQERVSEAELERAKAYLLGSLSMDRRTNTRQAWYLAFFELAGVGYEFLERYAGAVEAVGVDDVQRVAREYLARPTIVIVRPVPK